MGPVVSELEPVRPDRTKGQIALVEIEFLIV